MKEPYTYSQAAANRRLELADKENEALRTEREALVTRVGQMQNILRGNGDLYQLLTDIQN